MSSEKNYQAIVEKIIPEGRHGPYAVATNEELGPITFALDNSVWQGEDWPEAGIYVVLSQIRRKRAGWRAAKGRFFGPSDQKRETKQTQLHSKE